MIHRVFHRVCGCPAGAAAVGRGRSHRPYLARVSALALGGLLLLAAPARAGEIAAFLAEPSPGEDLGKAYGGSLSATFFRVVAFEGEFARYPGVFEGQGMTSFSGGAFVAPRLGLFTPYGGLGVGVFRQTLGGRSDNGTLSLFALGLKLHVGIVVFRAEYRTLGLSGDPLFPVEKRYSLGAGIDF
jgi:hypothetical protein